MFEKKYNPGSIQQEILSKQNRKKIFANKEIKKAGEKNTVTILGEPIILDGEHTSYGQLLQKIKEDCIVRYQRMLGKNIQRSPYFGHETSSKQNKQGKGENKNSNTAKQKEKRIKHMIEMGIGCDETKIQDMNSPNTTRKIRNFIDLCMQNGWIKQDIAINYRCNHKQTNISPEEITWKKSKCKCYSLRYFVDTKNITLLVKTTTPETIFGDVALAVHPEDRRYKKLIGQKVIIPIINKTIPIIGEETVDSLKYDGVMRVTPCHDIWSLEVAKKHKLNLKKFAIDHNGCFTTLAENFAGKKVADFFDNIIQNLDDIHNLESTQHIEQEIPTDRDGGGRLEPILSTQWFFSPPENIVAEAQQHQLLDTIQIYPSIYQELWKKNADNTTLTCRSISKKEAKGMLLPMRESKSETYIISEHKILNLPARKAKNKRIIPTLLLFNLITDQKLSCNFSLEECIEVLMSPANDEQTIGELYMDIFSTDIPRGYKSEINEFLKLFEYANKEAKGLVNYEKFASQLMEILEKSACINKVSGRYIFDAAGIINTDEEVTLADEKIDSNLCTAVFLLEQSGILSQKEAEKTIFLGEEKEKNMILKTCILGKTLQKKLPVQEIDVFPNTIHCSKTTREEISNKRGADTLRLQSIIQDTREEGKIRGEEAEKHLAFINKMWNACRYIFLSYIDNPKKRKPIEIDLEDIGSYIDKRLAKLEPNEYRMLCRIKELYTELPEHVNKNSIAELGTKIIECVKQDFCDKYLEIIKIRNTEFTEKIATFCVGSLIQILHPMAPFFTEALWKLFNFSGTIHQQKEREFLTKGNKNYKTQLFMDIIDKFILLREKTNQAKHQKVDIAFQASIDFLHYIKENEDIINKLVNVNEIVYINNEKDLQKYETDTIIDVTIGIKGVSKTLKQPEGRDDWAAQLAKKQARLQEIRNITSKLSLDKKNKRIVEKKKEEMNQLKKEIEKLEFEIKKSKMNDR